MNPESFTAKILIIDDDPLFHKLIGSSAELLGHSWQAVHDLKEALLEIQEAEKTNSPYSIITIDMKYNVGRSEMPFGKNILRTIKSKYPDVACIIISGAGMAAHEVLDLRDNFGLDYYISKDRLDPDTLSKGIERALNRVKPVDDKKLRKKLLESLTFYENARLSYLRNLAFLEETKAKQGIDVSIKIENEIQTYTNNLKKIEEKVQEIKKRIDSLNITS